MPGLGKAPACAVIGNFERLQPWLLQQCNLLVQTLAALKKVGNGLGIAEIHLVDDGQHRNLEKNRVQPRAFDGDIDFTIRQRRDRDVFVVELEQAQKIHEIAFDEAQRTQVSQLGILKAQLAQRANFFTNFVDVRGQLNARIAALEAVLHLCARELMQHHLHHREFIQVGI